MKHELKIRCQANERLFKASYQLNNQLEGDLFVACHAVDVVGQQYPNDAYTALSKDEKQVNFELGYSNLPLDRDVEFSVCCQFRKVASKASLQGEIEIELPLLEWNAYSLKVPPDKLETPLAIQHFNLSILCISEEDAESITELEGDLFSVFGKQEVVSQAFSTPFAVSVFKKQSSFPRT